MTVMGCNGVALAGAAVSLTGAATFSATTDAYGACSFPAAPIGTYSVTVSKARFVTQTYSVTLDVHCATNRSFSTELLPASGYVCCGSCPDPLPTTFYLTDSNGTHAVTYGGGPINLPGWGVNYSVTTTVCSCTLATYTSNCSFCGGTASGSVRIFVKVDCPRIVGGAYVSTLRYFANAGIGPLSCAYAPGPYWNPNNLPICNLHWYDIMGTGWDICCYNSQTLAPGGFDAPDTGPHLYPSTAGGTCAIPFSATFSGLATSWTFNRGAAPNMITMSLPALATGPVTVTE